MKIHVLAVASLLSLAACASNECFPKQTVAFPAFFVVTVQDAVTQQPLTAGVSVVGDNGAIGYCVGVTPGSPDAGVDCANGWLVAFKDNSALSTDSVAHTITVTATGHRSETLHVTAKYKCGEGPEGGTMVVAWMQPQ